MAIVWFEPWWWHASVCILTQKKRSRSHKWVVSSSWAPQKRPSVPISPRQPRPRLRPSRLRTSCSICSAGPELLQGLSNRLTQTRYSSTKKNDISSQNQSFSALLICGDQLAAVIATIFSLTNFSPPDRVFNSPASLCCCGNRPMSFTENFSPF